jgi:peroxiredoxin Q/BCP
MRAKRQLVALALCLGLCATGLLAADLKVGDTVPPFECKDDTGKIWKSSDHIGKQIVVVYFYPAATTGGCTKQACSYRDNMDKLKEKGVEVIGVSGDTPEGQAIFKKLDKLNFTLLADEKGEVAKIFGVPTKEGGGKVTAKDEKGKVAEENGKPIEITRGVTEQRWTFVFGKDGKLLSKDTKVVAAEDAKKVLEIFEKAK